MNVCSQKKRPARSLKEIKRKSEASLGFCKVGQSWVWRSRKKDKTHIKLPKSKKKPNEHERCCWRWQGSYEEGSKKTCDDEFSSLPTLFALFLSFWSASLEDAFGCCFGNFLLGRSCRRVFFVNHPRWVIAVVDFRTTFHVAEVTRLSSKSSKASVNEIFGSGASKQTLRHWSSGLESHHLRYPRRIWREVEHFQLNFPKISFS